MKINLRPYQAKIINELKYVNSIGLFMGTGSGKTLTSLYRYKLNPTKNLLIVCPSKIINQWEKTILDYKEDIKPNVIIWKSKDSWSAKKFNEYLKSIHYKQEFIDSNNIVLVSINKLKDIPALHELIDKDWTIIVDESHKIKELGTVRKPIQITKACLDIAPLSDYKIILTATPTQKDKGGYIDYYTQLKFLGYMDMSIREFKDTYCIEKKLQIVGRPYPIKVIDGYRQSVSEIEAILKLTCRRYIPKFTDEDPQHIKVDLDIPKNYNKMVSEKYYEDLDLTNLSARRIAYKTMCGGTVTGTDLFKTRLNYNDNKIKEEWLSEFLSNTDEIVVIFYNYNVEREVIKKVCKALEKTTIVIDGANNHKYEDVQRTDYNVVIGQFKACGESIDGLQYRSHICVYYSIPESSLEYRQALGRIDRDGQVNLPIYYYLICNKTIESKIYKLMESKIEYSERTLNELCV